MLCLQLGNNHVCLTSTSLMHKKKIVHKTSMASTKLKDLLFFNTQRNIDMTILISVGIF